MIRVGIIGGAGYTAGELLRILIYHPIVHITSVQSTSNAGKSLASVHSNLLGDTDLYFLENMDFNSVDVIFLCMGHGKSKDYLSRNTVPPHVGIIDLSHDYRLKVEGNDFIYGLPELNGDSIKMANKIANPGCFATAIQFALLPLAAVQALNEVHVNAITGSGQKQSEKYKTILIPGYTHLQVAMPSSFGLWFGAYAESLTDDMLMLNAAWKISNQNPLGAAAGYGSSFPLNRQLTTDLLGFENMNYNVVYAQMGRGKTEKM